MCVCGVAGVGFVVVMVVLIRIRLAGVKGGRVL